MSAATIQVESEPAVELAGLAAHSLELVLDDYEARSNLAQHLAAALGYVATASRVDADQLQTARWYLWCGHRYDMTRVFGLLNPRFGPVHHGCYRARSGDGEDQKRQAAAQRRELALALGDRVADALDRPGGHR